MMRFMRQFTLEHRIFFLIEVNEFVRGFAAAQFITKI